MAHDVHPLTARIAMSPENVEEIRVRAATALGLRDLALALSDRFSPKLGSNYRRVLREQIATDFGITDNALFDLSNPPQLPHKSLSISHCPTLGGYAAVPLPLRIGFDIEVSSRVTPQLVGRVRRKEDAPEPAPAFLWGAKEAAFKCLLLGQQPTTLTEISVPTWGMGKHGEFLFTAKIAEPSMKIDGYGTVFEMGPWVLCFFVDRSQTSLDSTDTFISRTE